MKREDFVDFHIVRPEHIAIDARLQRWASWVRVRPVGWQTQPIFRQYRSKSWQWERPEVRASIDLIEAVATEKAVSSLPPKNRDAVRWCYVFGGRPGPFAIHLGVSKQGLVDLITAGRTMLANRI